MTRVSRTLAGCAPGCSSSARSAESMSSCRAKRTTAWPEEVSSTGRVRFSTGRPTATSRARTRWLTADAVTRRWLAAASKLPWATMAARVRAWSGWMSIISSSYVGQRIINWLHVPVPPSVEHVILSLLSGLASGLSLIVAIGAQNAFVLRQGVQRSHVLLVVAVCALSDLVLIVLGVAGVGVLIEQAPGVLERRALGRCRLPPGVRPDGCTAGHPRNAGVPAVDRAAGNVGGRPGDLPRADLAEPPRLPGHRAAAGVPRRHPRRGRTVVVCGRSADSAASRGSPRWAPVPGTSRRCSPGRAAGACSTAASPWSWSPSLSCS